MHYISFNAYWMLKTGRIHFSSTVLHLLTESVLARQMEKITSLSEKTENLQNWQNKANFAVEDEVNNAVVKDYEARGYVIGPMAPGARSAGLAMLSPGVPLRHLYSFDAAYYVTKPGEELAVLGEVKHSLRVQDVKDLEKKVSWFQNRLKKIEEGTLPVGSPVFEAQKEMLRRYVGVPIQVFVGTVHVDVAALAESAGKGYSVVLPGGARFERLSVDVVNGLVSEWSSSPAASAEAEAGVW
ncbi:hypothetical protein PLESTB_000073800 [Pleodorina starrii]|uniref:Uncharacterized protein n=1 Tax=Pleodorina starrii TaxID=330485 RepID=A0A9W6B9W1_9CHLO|nr:hypothetical protein PLESTB_000073800 [Pleodorina starrii]GLC66526.1 hypothetical protein PLESTF_000440100 [Pleodorina starrii]